MQTRQVCSDNLFAMDPITGDLRWDYADGLILNSTITVADGRGWSKTTTYEYSGGEYDEDERVWLGFGYAKETQPPLPGEPTGPYTETWFR